jgi:predicted AAA+ superfamily ATPase
VKFFNRQLAPRIKAAARHFPALVVTGPRRAGKTTLLRRLFPSAQYVMLEDPDLRDRVRSDPRAFLESLSPPVLFDEIQNTPELFNYIRTLIDKHPRRMGQWLFTGSQEAPLMRGVTESMAGRAAIFQLLPLSITESPKVSLLHGGYPEVLARPSARALWFSSYLQTYIERDVRAITNIRDIITFRRFLSILAARHGQLLNKTEIAVPLGISVPTVAEWLHVLEITNQVLLVPPYFENYGKRLVKTPKLYWTDSGMACYLLGIQTQAELDRSPFLGPIFEGAVAMEIIKHQINHALRPELYHFRDQQGLEVDFLIPRPGGRLWFVEAKASKTVRPAMARPLLALQKSAATKASKLLLVHRAPANPPVGTSIAPGARAVDLAHFAALMNSGYNF